MKILPVEAKLFHAEGRTDKMKLIVAFRNFANAPNKSKQVTVMSCKKFLLYYT
jgi:hypothetical protein